MTTALAELSRSTPKASSTRNDLLAQFSEPAPRAPIDVRGASRTFWACGLLAAGVAVGAWLILFIHAVVFEPGKVRLLDRLVPSKVEDLTLTLPAGKVELPPALMPVIAYVFLVLLASLAAKVVGMTIKHGVSLLRSESTPAGPEPEPDRDLPPLASAP